ncbi:hypothetical protein [Palaeococcus sp. (in: euryarchaeotes)]
MEMELKYMVSASLIGIGSTLALYGFLQINQSYINLGIAGVFLGMVILTFKSSKYVKKEAIENILHPYKSFFDSFVDNLSLEGNAIYIPPYENLPNGGIFIPLHDNFDLDLARLDESTVFLTDVPNEKAMGLFVGPLGLDLLRKYEEHLEYSLKNTNSAEVEASASSVLKTLGLTSTVYIDQLEEGFRIVIKPKIECKPHLCEKVACPICSSILLGLAKATGELIHVESIEKKDYGIEIKAKRLGGVREWM